ERVRALCAGRRLVLYAPTYRDASVARELGYHFSAAEIAALGRVLERHGAVLGVRGHYLANAGGLLPEPGSHPMAPVVDLGHAELQEPAPLLRASAVVLTDYASVSVAALYLVLPVLAFAYDLEHSRDHQNGLLYDMELAFPGPIERHFDGLLREL